MERKSLASDPAIEVRDLQFRWQPREPCLLRIPHLQLARGERVWLTGPSGSGKSTLLGLLAGMNRPEQGQIRLLGEDLTRWSQTRRDRWRADHIGYIFQQFNLLPYLSPLENVALACRFAPARRARIAAAGSTVRQQAHQALERLELGTATTRSGRLSVGQQQRVAAARALIGAPGIVLADEPTSALDPLRRQRFLEWLFEECARQGATLLVVGHDGELAGRFDRVLSLTALNTASGADACPSPLPV